MDGRLNARGFLLLAAVAAATFGTGLALFGLRRESSAPLSVRALEFLEELDIAPPLIRRNNAPPLWVPPLRAGPYLPHIDAASEQYGLPHNLLARLIYQESRFRDDIISGDVDSSAGAVGIAQIVPRFHPGVDPLDPLASIYYAAGYLRRQFDRFGTWALALAAYNWGPTALADAGGDLSEAPRETRDYVSQISQDVWI